MSKKTKIIISITIILLIIATIAGVITYNNIQEEKNVTAHIETINAHHAKFEKEKIRTEKLNLLKTELKEFEEYKKSEEPNPEIIKSYEAKLKFMREYFTADYEAQISKNTIKDIEKSEDKEALNNAKDSLEKLLKTIQSEKNTISSETEVKEYEKKINALTKSYDTRITDIEEAEEKATAEKKAAEEAKAKESQKKTSTTTTTTTASNSATSNNNSSNPGQYTYPYPSWFKHYWYTDPETGEKIPGSDSWQNPKTGIWYYEDNSWHEDPFWDYY